MSSPNPQVKPNLAFRYYLKNEKPVNLIEFTEALKAIQSEYVSFSKSNGIEVADAKLYIQKIKEGSIICDLVEYFSSGLLPFAEGASTLFEFYGHLKNVYDYLTQRKEEQPNNLSVSTLNNAQKIIQPVVGDNRATIDMIIIDGNTNTIYNNCSFQTNSNEANAAQNRAFRKMEELKEIAPENEISERVLLRITQLNSEQNRADRGVIEKISERPMKILLNEEDKELFTSSDHNPFRFLYLVDAKKHISQNKIVAYEVLKVHEKFEE